MPDERSSARVGPVGVQFNNFWVIELDEERSSEKKRPVNPKCCTAFSGAMDTVGRSRPRPIASAISLDDTLVSPTACKREPVGAFSSPSRIIVAASVRCTAAYPVDPSPT